MLQDRFDRLTDRLSEHGHPGGRSIGLHARHMRAWMPAYIVSTGQCPNELAMLNAKTKPAGFYALRA